LEEKIMFTQLKSAVLVLAVVLMSNGPVSAQSGNLFGNPGFENPVITQTPYENVPESAATVWQTTHPDLGNGRVIEFRRNGTGLPVAAGGQQFIETSAVKRSMVFQKLNLKPGLRYEWSFCHKGRYSATVKDVAEFRIGLPAPPTGSTGYLPADTYSYTIVKVATTNNGTTSAPIPGVVPLSLAVLVNPPTPAGPTGSGWVKYSGTFTYPMGAPTSAHVGFWSVSGAAKPGADDPDAWGNFIDDAFIAEKPTGGCCPSLSAVPHPQPQQSIDYRTFTITNPAGAGAICSIDIMFAPTVAHQGGDLFIDGAAVSTGTQFVSPYNRLPKPAQTSLSPPAAHTVVFNLGVDYTIGWVGEVTFTVNYCDGTKCTLTYARWVARPPVPGPDVISVEHLLGKQRVHLKESKRPTPVRWISFMTENAGDQLFASPAATGLKGNHSNIKVEDDGMKSNSVLYAFKQPLKSNQASEPFDLILMGAKGAPTSPNLVWTTYDEHANAIARGKLAFRGTDPEKKPIDKKKPPQK
jgi:hypothetical protein